MNFKKHHEMRADSRLADISTQDLNQFLVTGDLDYSNVMYVYKKSMGQIKKHTNLVFDFSKLSSSNSAGLALMIEWIKFAANNKINIEFVAIPEHLKSIAKAARIENLFSHRHHEAVLRPW